MADAVPSDTMAEESAASTLASVPELVEHMLLQLPLRDILLAQRVSKSWKIIISTSPRIQKALFFRPVEDVQLRLINTGVVPTRPCASQADCPTREPNEEWEDQSDWEDKVMCWAVDGEDQQEYRMVINPILHYERLVELVPWSETTCRSSSSTMGEPLNKPPYLREEASWRKMLLGQPPLKQAWIDCGDAYHWHSIQAKDGLHGLTLGDLYESICSFEGILCEVLGTDMFLQGVPESGELMLAELEQPRLE